MPNEFTLDPSISTSCKQFRSACREMQKDGAFMPEQLGEPVTTLIRSVLDTPGYTQAFNTIRSWLDRLYCKTPSASTEEAMEAVGQIKSNRTKLLRRAGKLVKELGGALDETLALAQEQGQTLLYDELRQIRDKPLKMGALTPADDEDESDFCSLETMCMTLDEAKKRKGAHGWQYVPNGFEEISLKCWHPYGRIEAPEFLQNAKNLMFRLITESPRLDNYPNMKRRVAPVRTQIKTVTVLLKEARHLLVSAAQLKAAHDAWLLLSLYVAYGDGSEERRRKLAAVRIGIVHEIEDRLFYQRFSKGGVAELKLLRSAAQRICKRFTEDEAIRTLIQPATRASQESTTNGDNDSAEEEAPAGKRKPSENQMGAYNSYIQAVSGNSHLEDKKDREVYDWIKDRGVTDDDSYVLPSFQTWQRYLRAGRNFRGTQKNTRRAGRTGRSIVGYDEIEPPSNPLKENGS